MIGSVEYNLSVKQMFGYKFRNMGNVSGLKTETGASLHQKVRPYSSTPLYDNVTDQIAYLNAFSGVYDLSNRLKSMDLRDEWNVVIFIHNNIKYSVPCYVNQTWVNGKREVRSIKFLASFDIAHRPGIIMFATGLIMNVQLPPQPMLSYTVRLTEIVPQLLISVPSILLLDFERDPDAVQHVSDFIRNGIKTGIIGAENSLYVLFEA